MTFPLFKEVIKMKKLALVATGFVCAGLLGACSSQGMATSTKDMSQQTAKAGARQPSGKKVKDVSLQGVDGKTYRLSDYKGKMCAYAIHKFFQERDFVYVHTPLITGSDCEGAGEMYFPGNHYRFLSLLHRVFRWGSLRLLKQR